MVDVSRIPNWRYSKILKGSPIRWTQMFPETRFTPSWRPCNIFNRCRTKALCRVGNEFLWIAGPRPRRRFPIRQRVGGEFRAVLRWHMVLWRMPPVPIGMCKNWWLKGSASYAWDHESDLWLKPSCIKHASCLKAAEQSHSVRLPLIPSSTRAKKPSKPSAGARKTPWFQRKQRLPREAVPKRWWNCVHKSTAIVVGNIIY